MTDASEKLLAEAMGRSDFVRHLFRNTNVEEIIERLCSQINPNEDPINVLAAMTPEQRAEIKQKLTANMPMYKTASYGACFREVGVYDNEVPIKVINADSGYLDSVEKVAFEVAIPIDDEKLYISDQYLHTRLVIEPLSATQIAALVASPPPGIVAFDPANIRYRFCAKPGIRLIQNIDLYSDNVPAYGFTQNIMLYKDKREIPIRSEYIWNEMIGHDLGQAADVVMPDLNAMESRIFKIGAQTPKSVPDPLEMFIPLFFEYNMQESGIKLGTGTFREGTLAYRGRLAPSTYMARAEYYSATSHPIVLPTPKVRLDTFNLIGKYTYLSDYLHALNIYQPWARLLASIHEERQVLSDMDKQLPIQSQAVAQTVVAAIRPLEYETDFDLWVHFQRVSERCVQVPVIIQNPVSGLPNTAAVQAAKVTTPWPMVRKVGVICRDIALKPKQDTEIYEYVQQYQDGFRDKHMLAKPAAGLYEFCFNENFPSKLMSGVLNLGALRDVYVDFEFFPGQVNLENVLSEKMELITFIHYLDQIRSYGRTLGTTYMI